MTAACSRAGSSSHLVRHRKGPPVRRLLEIERRESDMKKKPPSKVKEKEQIPKKL
jgi:hypothetical protein